MPAICALFSCGQRLWLWRGRRRPLSGKGRREERPLAAVVGGARAGGRSGDEGETPPRHATQRAGGNFVLVGSLAALAGESIRERDSEKYHC